MITETVHIHNELGWSVQEITTTRCAENDRLRQNLI